MSWDDFFDHLVTSENIRLWFARLAVSDRWNRVLIILLVVCLSSVMLIKKKNVLQEPTKWWRLCVQGAVVSSIAWIVLFVLQIWLHSPKVFLPKIVPGILSFWQLSPLGITKLLNYLSWLGKMEIALVLVIIFWFLYTSWSLVIKSLIVTSAEGPSQNQFKQTTKESDFISPDDRTFGLLFLADEDGEIEKVRFGDGTVLSLGEMTPKQITITKLYFRLLHDEKLVEVLEYEPTEYDAKLTLTKAGEFKLQKKSGQEGPDNQVLSLGSAFAIKNCKFKLCSTSDAKTGGKGMPVRPFAITMLTSLVLLLIFISTLPVRAEDDQQLESCFYSKDKDKSLQLLSNGQDSWLVYGQVSVLYTDAVRSSAFQPRLRIKYDQNNVLEDSLTIERSNWHLKNKVLYLKILFDLDASAIYSLDESNPLSSKEPDAGDNETEFWKELLLTILNPFYQALEKGDIDKVDVSVFSMSTCGNIRPGAQILSTAESKIKDKELSFAGSLTPITIAIKCGYNPSDAITRKDVSKDVWDQKISTGDNAGDNEISSNNNALIVIRWQKQELDDESYEILTPYRDVPSSRVVIFDIHRNYKQASISKTNGYSVVHIQAPKIAQLSGKIPPQAKGVINDLLNARISDVEFSVKMPKLIDEETWQNPTGRVELTKSEVVVCTTTTENSTNPKDPPKDGDGIKINSSVLKPKKVSIWPSVVLFIIALVTLIFAVWTTLIMIVLFGSVIEKFFESLEGENASQ